MTTIINGSSPSITFSDSTTQSSGVNTTNPVFTGDATISGLTVGKGGGSVSTNTAVGASALAANTTAANSTAVGYQAGNSNVTGDDLNAFGYQSFATSTGGANSGFGSRSGRLTTTGTRNSAFGYYSLYTNTTGSYNTAIGDSSLYSNTTASNSTAVGYQAGYTSTADNLTAIGYKAGYSATTNAGNGGNVFVGKEAGVSNAGGQDNTYIGGKVAHNATGSGNVAIGFLAGSSDALSIFNIATNSDRIVIGSTNTTNAYVKVAWTVTSDARDKTDVTPSTYGLSFVTALKPVTFKWDERANYKNSIPDGSKKKSKTQLGFLAQDIIALEESLGTSSSDLLIADNEQDDKLKITETKMIPVLVKAIQELKAEFDAYKATHP